MSGWSGAAAYPVRGKWRWREPETVPGRGPASAFRGAVSSERARGRGTSCVGLAGRGGASPVAGNGPRAEGRAGGAAGGSGRERESARTVRLTRKSSKPTSIRVVRVGEDETQAPAVHYSGKGPCGPSRLGFPLEPGSVFSSDMLWFFSVPTRARSPCGAAPRAVAVLTPARGPGRAGWAGRAGRWPRRPCGSRASAAPRAPRSRSGRGDGWRACRGPSPS